MKVKLVSDFHDFYDHWFDLEGDVFRRVTTDGLDRLEIFEYLQKLDFKVPLFGPLKEVARHLKPEELVVLHHDLRAHRGEGKELVRIDAALEEFPETLASEYIPFHTEEPHFGIKGLSWRYLQVGMHSFWLEYTCTDDWRSNYGDTNVRVMFRDKTELVPKHNYDLMLFKCPLFAIDFVPCGRKLYAVDFNIAPGIRGSGVEELLKPKEAADSIKNAYILLKGKFHEEDK